MPFSPFCMRVKCAIVFQSGHFLQSFGHSVVAQLWWAVKVVYSQRVEWSSVSFATLVGKKKKEMGSKREGPFRRLAFVEKRPRDSLNSFPCTHTQA